MCSGTCVSCKPVCVDECSKVSNKDFSAKEFVDNLLTKGSCLGCDETSEAFNKNALPPYYNEEMFKKGQAYFYKHMFGMFLGNLLGLLCGLSLKTSLAILILTKMSSSDLSAYKRYMATIFHMMIWYDDEFRPGSKLWESVKDVKAKHNSASKKSIKALQYPITQKDMALTQFGFMGFAITRSDFLGIYDKDKEGMKNFLHLWRVVGYVLGIEDEFNLCRQSFQETTLICNEIIDRVFKPEVVKRDEEYLQMCAFLINGLRCFNCFLNLNTFLFYMEATLNNSTASISNNNEDFEKLTKSEKIRLHVILVTIRLMRFSVVRKMLQLLQRFTLWLVKRWPFLAIAKFGKENAYVKVLSEH